MVSTRKVRKRPGIRISLEGCATMQNYTVADLLDPNNFLAYYFFFFFLALSLFFYFFFYFSKFAKRIKYQSRFALVAQTASNKHCQNKSDMSGPFPGMGPGHPYHDGNPYSSRDPRRSALSHRDNTEFPPSEYLVPARLIGASEEENSAIFAAATNRRRTKGRKPGAGLPRASTVHSAASVAKSSQKRQTDAQRLRTHPDLLCIENADPPRTALEARLKILKYHDADPHDGKPVQSENISFIWLPNASWVNDGMLSGFVFRVDGSEKRRDPTQTVPRATPVVADMFPRDKMLYGMLAIRLCNSKKNKLDLNPIDSLELYAENDFDTILRKTIQDGDDLSSDNAYAGFYISEDPTREWERNVWLVVSTGDKDISRTVHEYLKGDYNPQAAEDQSLQEIVDKMKYTLAQIQKASSSSGLSLTETEGVSRSDEKHEEDDVFMDDAIFTSPTDTGTRRDKPKVKKKASTRRSASKKVKEPLSTIQRLEKERLPEEKRAAWKYTKLIKEIHRLTQTHAINASASYASSSDMAPLSPELLLDKYAEEPKCVKHRSMTWENNLMKEPFMDAMLRRVKMKRWLVVSKLSEMLGFDLIKDFGIDPFDKNVDNYRNVVHVSVNSFVHNKRSAEMVFYSGAFCKHDMRGGLPVPISPLQGIRLLKGPPDTSAKSAEDKPNKKRAWSNSHRISTDRFRVVGSPEDTGDTKEIVGDDELRVFKLSSYTHVDKDEDLGGNWLLNNESVMSIDCHSGFPYGTGRSLAYIRLPPPPKSSASKTRNEEEENYTRKMESMVSSGRLPSHVVPTCEWGPRGVWVIGGSDGIRARQGRRVLFTWNNTEYPTHPRLARGMFRDRVAGFQTRETNLGWNPTFGSLHLQPKAVILHSPVDPLPHTFAGK